MLRIVKASSQVGFSNILRHFSSKPSALCAILANRAVVQVSGKESKEFLQGLITNDMDHLDESSTAQAPWTSGMYSVLLNTQGRIMFDVIVQKSNDDCYLIDCDRYFSQKLVKHLKMYKVRRKLDINVLDDSKVFAVFNFNSDSSVNFNFEHLKPFSDPRLDQLGGRVITDGANDELIMKNNFQMRSEVEHRILRYKLGISEGSDEIPPGKCFPHETNVDFMHGVSFQKGCYIGQELTARVQHTGVVRKRVMPFELQEGDGEISPDTDFLNEAGKKIGKLRCLEGQHGLGLMRITETLNAEGITLNGFRAKVNKPTWWPLEAPKKSLKSSSQNENTE